MANVIDNRSAMDQTVRIFDSFYAVDLSVGADQFDVVNSYFVGICTTKNVAANFTAILFRIAQETGIDVLTLLQQLKGAANKLQMNKIMAYYLNSFKSKSSLYGIGAVINSVTPVARNIVQ